MGKKRLIFFGSILMIMALALTVALGGSYTGKNELQNGTSIITNTATNDTKEVGEEDTLSGEAGAEVLASVKDILESKEAQETVSNEVVELELNESEIEEIIESATQNTKDFLIVIDAGHQSKGNYEEEAIGPGAKEKKPKVSSGTQGRFTGVAEYEVNLQVALKLEAALLEKGYSVMMVRTTNDVNISNQERAEIANDNDADVFIRIHCNGSENASVNGILTICPTENNIYCKDIYKDSRALSDAVLEGMLSVTGANNKGVTETDTMSGINWSLVPVTIVEMGYMTNEEEDNKLVTDEYQNKLVEGMVVGIESYLETK